MKKKKLKRRLKRLELNVGSEQNKTISIWGKGTMSYEKAFIELDKDIRQLKKDTSQLKTDIKKLTDIK